MCTMSDSLIMHRTVAKIQKKIVKQGKRDAASRFFHAKRDKDEIAAWKLELHMILQVFNVRLASLTLMVTKIFHSD